MAALCDAGWLGRAWTQYSTLILQYNTVQYSTVQTGSRLIFAPDYLFSYMSFTSESLLSKVLGGASFPSTREYSSGLSALSPPPPLLAELEPDFLELKHVSITLRLVTWAATQ